MQGFVEYDVTIPDPAPATPQRTAGRPPQMPGPKPIKPPADLATPATEGAVVVAVMLREYCAECYWVCPVLRKHKKHHRRTGCRCCCWQRELSGR